MTEGELCEKFRLAAIEDGWTVYPEQAGWDLLLVWEGPDVVVQEAGRAWGGVPGPPAVVMKTGDQVGVEAKLRSNCEVLAQVLHRRSTPHFRAVLVPKAATGFETVAIRLELGVYTLEHCGPYTIGRKAWLQRELPRRKVEAPRWRRALDKPMWLPPVVPTTAAGVPSPRRLTVWRVSALRICHLLRTRGYVTSKDFRDHGIHSSRWINSWVRNGGEKEGRLVKYVIREFHHDADGNPCVSPDFPDIGFEAERDAIAAQDATEDKQTDLAEVQS